MIRSAVAAVVLGNGLIPQTLMHDDTRFSLAEISSAVIELAVK